jgi:hypothetical protein
MTRNPFRAGVFLLALCPSAGCFSLGPQTIERDRFDYVQALRRSWKEEMLLNVVGLRYLEVPVFLQVTSVINQYRLEGRLEGTVGAVDDAFTAGATATNQPTITYVPLAGEAFTRELLTPVSPGAVVSMLQSGWPASLVFRIIVRSINGIGTGLRQAEDERFLRIVERLERIQAARALGLRVVQRDEGQTVLVVFPTTVDVEIAEELRALQSELGLAPEARELRLVYGQSASAPDEIAILTRSAIEVLIDLGAYATVPEEDVAEGRTLPTRASPTLAGMPPLIRIDSGPAAPDDAFVSVRFRERWYWIDDKDLPSKRTFAFTLLVMSLSAGGVAGGLPVVTVSAGS